MTVISPCTWRGEGLFRYFCWASAAAICRAQGDRAVFRQSMLLLVFALLSELASQVARPEYTVLNVLFTLSLGVALAPAVLRLRAAPRALIYALAAAFMGLAGAFEFGLAGALLPLAIAGAVMGSRLDMAAALLLAALGNFRGYWGGWPPPATTAGIMLAATVWPLFVLWLAGQMAQGAQRLLPRYALHVFYPAHMLVLAGLRLLFA